MILKASDNRRFLDLSRNFAVRCHNGNPLKFLRIEKNHGNCKMFSRPVKLKPTKTYQNLLKS